MKPETRKALQAGRDFQPGFYADMCDEERADHEARDNGVIPRGPVVGKVFNLDGVRGISAADLGLTPSTDPGYTAHVGDTATDKLGQVWRVASWAYRGVGIAVDGSETFEQVITLTRAEDDLSPIDVDHVDRMRTFDEDMGALIEAGATGRQHDALVELGGSTDG